MGEEKTTTNHFAKSIERLTNDTAYDVTLYLDERGTPGIDRLFITGGVLLYNEEKAIKKAWKKFATEHGLPKKGTKFNATHLLDTAEFLIQNPILPVVIWSELANGDLERLKGMEIEYRESQNPHKRVDRISAAHWLRYRQMAQTIATAQSSFLTYVGRISAARVFIDQFSDHTEMEIAYKQIVERHSTRTQFETVLSDVPTKLKKMLLTSVPEKWNVDLNAKGGLSSLADAMCAMYGRFRAGECQEPWEVVRMRYVESGNIPPCLGADITWDIRKYLYDYNSFDNT